MHILFFIYGLTPSGFIPLHPILRSYKLGHSPIISNPEDAPLCPGDKAQVPCHSTKHPHGLFWPISPSSCRGFTGAKICVEHTVLAHALFAAKFTRPNNVCLPRYPRDAPRSSSHFLWDLVHSSLNTALSRWSWSSCHRHRHLPPYWTVSQPRAGLCVICWAFTAWD